ncbi:MAG: GNAT family N-acetyltransferase [Ruminococcaceae bacterium]|nr:GNAT family N-acetyltransferase [Oscillospiraceae bacterium]
MSEIIYDCRWSDNVDDKFIADFIATENAVFNCGYTEELFRKKYIDNIFGKSIVEVVYLDGQPVAARGLWRNDVDGKRSYQPGDTCVTEICRGKGIFTEMTKKSLELTEEGDLIYNFPNQNSFPGYMKMGWKLVGEYGLVLFGGNKRYLSEHPQKMDAEYADWWLDEKNEFFVKKSGKEYYLVRKIRGVWYRIVACVEEDVAKRFPKMGFGVCFYRSTRKTFYNKKLGAPLHVVSKGDAVNIPLWKMDVI